MALFYVEATWGCGIREARTLDQAERDFRAEAGNYSYKSVRKATPADCAWVGAMGGDVPQQEKRA
jgi:hypothetical protein